MERKILIFESITKEVVVNAIKKILSINKIDDKEEKKNKNYRRSPIEIYISSNGGDVGAAYALYDIIQKSKTPIYTIGLGEFYSSAFVIFLAGHLKFVGDNSVGMYHGIELTNEVLNVNNLKSNNTRLNILNENLSNIIKDNIKCKYVYKGIDANIENADDVYLSAEKMYKLGIADDYYTNYMVFDFKTHEELYKFIMDNRPEMSGIKEE